MGIPRTFRHNRSFLVDSGSVSIIAVLRGARSQQRPEPIQGGLGGGC